MKVNWILRLKNKATLTSLVAIIIAAVYQIFGIFGYVPVVDQEWVVRFVGLIITGLAALGIITDPTTDGVSDSNQAMDYTRPYKEMK